MVTSLACALGNKIWSCAMVIGGDVSFKVKQLQQSENKRNNSIFENEQAREERKNENVL